MASKDFILTKNEADLANKERELAAWAAKITRKQHELYWERGKRAKARVEAAETVKRRDEMEKVAAEAQVALERAKGVWKYLMESRV